MSKIRVESITIENYRSFGTMQKFEFSSTENKKPTAIVGYNNSGKTNLMNCILYGLNYKFVYKDTFGIDDFHNRDLNNIPKIILKANSSTEDKYDGKKACLLGTHKLEISLDGDAIEGAKINSFYPNGEQNYQSFGALRYFNVFYINFHEIKKEIATKKTSWGNLTSFLAKHIKSIVENDIRMSGKKDEYEQEVKTATDKVLEDSDLSKFITKIKHNYHLNLRNNDCEVSFGLPDYHDIFLQMVFKVGLNGDNSNLIPIEHFGDGYISMFVMAVIQAIAESNTTDKCLFLFEEPESFLHENHQEYFYKMVLCSLAEKGHQVIYTTHSDKMLDIFNTENIIRLEFDTNTKQTIKKYNNILPLIPPTDKERIVNLSNFNSFIKSVEPNLNKILFSRKAILVEGSNDLLSYNYAIEKSLKQLGKSDKFAQTYLSFLNIVILPHHGKITAIFLSTLCKHFGLDYFIINDWDFEEDFVDELSLITDKEALKSSNRYLKDAGADRSSNLKGMITTNWKLIKNAVNINQIHFNIRKLESVIDYSSEDKNTLKIWEALEKLTSFSEKFFPQKLKDYLEFDSISLTIQELIDSNQMTLIVTSLEKQKTTEFPEEEIL